MSANCTYLLVLSQEMRNILSQITIIELIIVMSGLVLNIFNIIILLKANLNESPYTYLYNLAMSDLIILINALLNYIVRKTGIFDSQIIYFFNKFYLIPVNNMTCNTTIYLTLAISGQLIFFRYNFC